MSNIIKFRSRNNLFPIVNSCTTPSHAKYTDFIEEPHQVLFYSTGTIRISYNLNIPFVTLSELELSGSMLL